MDDLEVEQLEIDLLLEAVHRRHGYDFRSYARASVERRIRQLLTSTGVSRASELIPRVLTDETFFSELAQRFSVSVTDMFRDPFVYRAIREKVVPVLGSYPFTKVWHAGCATGEEVYSLAIVLQEAGLVERSTLFGTDFNDRVLTAARRGIYPVNRVQEFSRNYQQSGGTGSFADYYHAAYETATLARSLRERVTFANHNLATDGVFGEMHLILCRNVLIYFDRSLQNRALGLFTESLVRGGFLCLGTREDIRLSDHADDFEVVDAPARIYKKRMDP